MSGTAQLQRYAQIIESMIAGASPSPLPQDLTKNLPTNTALDDLIKSQQLDGAFLPPDQKMHPEMRWYEELLILHSLAARAVVTRDPALNAAVKKAAEFHLREIQPDHATAHPWGLLAFIQYTPPLADQVLHAVQLQYPDGIHGTAFLLLQDVLYGLRLLITEKT